MVESGRSYSIINCSFICPRVQPEIKNVQKKNIKDLYVEKFSPVSIFLGVPSCYLKLLFLQNLKPVAYSHVERYKGLYMVNAETSSFDFIYRIQDKQIEINYQSFDHNLLTAELIIYKQKSDTVWCEVIENEIGEVPDGLLDLRIGSLEGTTSKFVSFSHLKRGI